MAEAEAKRRRRAPARKGEAANEAAAKSSVFVLNVNDVLKAHAARSARAAASAALAAALAAVRLLVALAAHFVLVVLVTLVALAARGAPARALARHQPSVRHAHAVAAERTSWGPCGASVVPRYCASARPSCMHPALARRKSTAPAPSRLQPCMAKEQRRVG